MVIVPDYLISHRRYPVHVYIYAINEYCNCTNKSQRESAKKTRVQFGLETFAHTTLGRAFKKLCMTIDEINKTQTKITGIVNGDIESQAHHDLPQRREYINRFLSKWLTKNISNIREFELSCQIMARRIWQLYQKMLI